jgi:sortase A
MAKVYRKKTSSMKSPQKIAGLLLVGVGFITLLFFFFPILSWHVYFSKALATNTYEAPVPKSMVVTPDSNSFQTLLTSGVSQLTTDFGDARNWYPKLEGSLNKAKISEYLLSIPKINVENAVVSTTSYDLEKHLVQYAGTVVPGENGTAVIFGHSTLPQLYKKDNYKTIFANLHKVKVDDTLIVSVGDVKYTYTIYAIAITEAEDTNMFSQSFDNSYITLVTCTPPGTLWKRLIVRARLEKL